MSCELDREALASCQDLLAMARSRKPSLPGPTADLKLYLAVYFERTREHRWVGEGGR